MPSLLPGESDSNPADSLIQRSAIVGYLLPALHAASTSAEDLAPWTECELIQWLDEAIKKLARTAAVFAGRDIDGATVAEQQVYSLPTRHVSTLHVSYDQRPLRPANTAEIAARDSRWQTRIEAPARWFADSLGMGQYGLAPIPEIAKALWVIYHGWPRTIDCAGAHATVPLPWALEPYLELEVIAQAYGREGDGHAPDIAQAARQMAGLYEALAVEYWGAAG
jgi:hypothetical protein